MKSSKRLSNRNLVAMFKLINITLSWRKKYEKISVKIYCTVAICNKRRIL